ncbi:hypothetical protein BV20DRAFT_133724 [Pilatotrama ljubarskyi]|nr:hypothetical protein BV20DRAFT_133724 [Pilatotrama ljubarskyi]
MDCPQDDARHLIDLSRGPELLSLLLTSTELGRDYRPGKPYVRSAISCRTVRAIEKGGLPMVVRYGTEVLPVEAEVTTFVARNTSIRVPKVYAVFSEVRANNRLINYIVEERLPGFTLDQVFPSLGDTALQSVAFELRMVYDELSKLSELRTTLGPLHGPHNSPYFLRLFEGYPCRDVEARSTGSLIEHLFKPIFPTPLSATQDHIAKALECFDLSIFSHGDLQPANVVYSDGHVVGIIDWEGAGWYPYFWDSFVVFKSALQLMCESPKWQQVLPTLCEQHVVEARRFFSIWSSAQDALDL